MQLNLTCSLSLSPTAAGEKQLFSSVLKGKTDRRSELIPGAADPPDTEAHAPLCGRHSDETALDPTTHAACLFMHQKYIQSPTLQPTLSHTHTHGGGRGVRKRE